MCDRPTNGRTDRPTDGATDWQTDIPSYRVARMHLKKGANYGVRANMRLYDNKKNTRGQLKTRPIAISRVHVLTHMYWDTHILTHMYWDTHILTHSYLDTLMYWHTHVLTHSCIDTLMYWHTHILTHSYIDTLIYWHSHVLTHSVFKDGSKLVLSDRTLQKWHDMTWHDMSKIKLPSIIFGCCLDKTKKKQSTN